MHFLTRGDKAMLKPVIIIKTICIPNESKSKKPSYHAVKIFRGVVSSQIKAPNAVRNVKRIAKTKASGINFKNRDVNFSPSFVIIFIMVLIQLIG